MGYQPKRPLPTPLDHTWPVSGVPLPSPDPWFGRKPLQLPWRSASERYWPTYEEVVLFVFHMTRFDNLPPHRTDRNLDSWQWFDPLLSGWTYAPSDEWKRRQYVKAVSDRYRENKQWWPALIKEGRLASVEITWDDVRIAFHKHPKNDYHMRLTLDSQEEFIRRVHPSGCATDTSGELWTVQKVKPDGRGQYYVAGIGKAGKPTVEYEGYAIIQPPPLKGFISYGVQDAKIPPPGDEQRYGH